MGHKYTSVLIAMPNMGWVRSDLVLPVARLLGLGAALCAPSGLKPTAWARNHCVDAFLAGDREWLWFVDHDVLPPDHALDLLLAAGKPAITGVVPTMKLDDRDGEVRPTPLTAKTAPDGNMRAYGGRGVEPIERCGAGCWLLHRSLFDVIGPPWFEDRVWPPEDRTGQDFTFCEKLAAAGVQLYAHFDVVCRHRKEVDL